MMKKILNDNGEPTELIHQVALLCNSGLMLSTHIVDMAYVNNSKNIHNTIVKMMGKTILKCEEKKNKRRKKRKTIKCKKEESKGEIKSRTKWNKKLMT